MVPYGRAGKEFVQELARFFRSYGEVGALESIAIKAALLMCAIPLQKPHPKTTNREIVACLQRRLSLRTQGGVTTLMDEGHVIPPFSKIR